MARLGSRISLDDHEQRSAPLGHGGGRQRPRCQAVPEGKRVLLMKLPNLELRHHVVHLPRLVPTLLGISAQEARRCNIARGEIYAGDKGCALRAVDLDRAVGRCEREAGDKLGGHPSGVAEDGETAVLDLEPITLSGRPNSELRRSAPCTPSSRRAPPPASRGATYQRPLKSSCRPYPWPWRMRTRWMRPNSPLAIRSRNRCETGSKRLGKLCI